ncbi:hypothetical protein [Streptomyces uncialis]|uniref:hypothetical protein n=1 Tax=Streptomyces uncialis TaxID=1048205 RepID=UPI0009A10E2E|nr:hypothetical protein [Streptomyces uncialis]
MFDTYTARAWLAAADPSPEHAERWMTNTGVTLLPLGNTWSAVKTEERAGLRVVTGLEGPAIHDGTGRAVYFLVPTTTEWGSPEGELLGGPSCWLGVPTPERTEPPGVYWLNPPDGSGLLVDPRALAAALGAAEEER